MPTADRTVPIVVRSAKNQRLRRYSFYGWDLVDRRYLWWVWAPRFYRWATSVRLERYELFVLFDHYELSRAGKAWGYVIRIVRSLWYLRHSAIFNYSLIVSALFICWAESITDTRLVRSCGKTCHFLSQFLCLPLCHFLAVARRGADRPGLQSGMGEKGRQKLGWQTRGIRHLTIPGDSKIAVRRRRR